MNRSRGPPPRKIPKINRKEVSAAEQVCNLITRTDRSLDRLAGAANVHPRLYSHQRASRRGRVHSERGSSARRVPGVCMVRRSISAANRASGRLTLLHLRRDSTIRDVLVLLRDAAPELRANPLARYSVKHVFFDGPRDRFISRDVAVVPAKDLLIKAATESASAVPGAPSSSRTDPRTSKTLAEFDFIAGDFLDVAYLVSHGPPLNARDGPGAPFGAGPPGRGPPPHGSGAGPARQGPAGPGFAIRGAGAGPPGARGDTWAAGRPPRDLTAHPWKINGAARPAQRNADNRGRSDGNRRRSPDVSRHRLHARPMLTHYRQ